MGAVRLTVLARSDVGRVRAHNEDAFAVSDLDSGARLESPAVGVDVRDRGVLLVVSDGMGGAAAGEVASQLVVDSLRSSLSDPAADHSSLQRLIDSAVRRANADVWQAAKAEERRGMGATLTAVLIHDTDAFVATVGDSRAYLLRGGRLRQITRDQSFVQLLVDTGALTPEQARTAPGRNVILQAMGLAPTVQVSIGRLRLRRGDRFLLCSDGLSSKVADEELQSLLGRDLAAACAAMIDLANQRGGDDNLTAVVAEVDGEGLPLPAPGERTTLTFEVLQDYPERKSDPAPRAEPTASSAPPSSRSEFSLAPMSGVIRSLTIAFLLLPLLLIGLALAGARALLAPALLVAGLDVAVAVLWRPTRFQVGERELVTSWPVRRKRYPLAGLSSVGVLDLAAFHARFGRALRVGVGGLFGGFGWLHTAKGGWVEMDLSRAEGLVLLEWPGRIPLLITPENPAGFVELVRREARLS